MRVHRGIWAGHCLEIIVLDRYTKSMLSDVAWKDISEEDAVEDMIQLLRDALPPPNQSRLAQEVWAITASTIENKSAKKFEETQSRLLVACK